MSLARAKTVSPLLEVEKKPGAEADVSTSGAEAAPEVPVVSGADTPRKARTVGQIKVKAVSSETLFTGLQCISEMALELLPEMVCVLMLSTVQDKLHVAEGKE